MVGEVKQEKHKLELVKVPVTLRVMTVVEVYHTKNADPRMLAYEIVKNRLRDARFYVLDVEMPSLLNSVSEVHKLGEEAEKFLNEKWRAERSGGKK